MRGLPEIRRKTALKGRLCVSSGWAQSEGTRDAEFFDLPISPEGVGHESLCRVNLMDADGSVYSREQLQPKALQRPNSDGWLLGAA
jgi:hypothetical protein